MQQLEQPLSYPNVREYEGTHSIKSMSKAFLKQEIAYIKRTGNRSEYLVALENELKIKLKPKFLPYVDSNMDGYN